jgi:SLT domain-containing protein
VSRDEHAQRAPLRRVGVAWKSRVSGSDVPSSGVLTIGRLRQRFLVVPNTRKRSDRDPDYLLKASEGPEVDPYADRQSEAES